MQALVIGGTRNLGPGIVQELVGKGFRVTVFHRGQTAASLPEGVERVLGDRRNEEDLKRAVGGRDFDLVVDTTLYTGPEGELAGRVLADRVGRYVMLSTGQVYLVREGLERPFREEDYEGPVMTDPGVGSADYGDWLYGVEKRAAEEALFAAGLPVTVLRLPMVNSERDHYSRMAAYWGRLLDGGPILVPAGPHPRLHHVYGGDVARCIGVLAESEVGRGRAFNLSQDEGPEIEEFLEELARLAGKPLRLVRVAREELEAAGLLLDCSPFSGRWMSTVDNGRSKRELGMVYTPWREYVAAIAKTLPDGARRDRRELELELGQP